MMRVVAVIFAMRAQHVVCEHCVLLARSLRCLECVRDCGSSYHRRTLVRPDLTGISDHSHGFWSASRTADWCLESSITERRLESSLAWCCLVSRSSALPVSLFEVVGGGWLWLVMVGDGW